MFVYYAVTCVARAAQLVFNKLEVWQWCSPASVDDDVTIDDMRCLCNVTQVAEQYTKQPRVGVHAGKYQASRLATYKSIVMSLSAV